MIEGAILQQLDVMQKSVPQATVGTSVTQTRQPVYLGIFVLAQWVPFYKCFSSGLLTVTALSVLQMVLALDAVYNKNTLQFLFLAAFNFSLLIYGALQIIEVQSNVT